MIGVEHFGDSEAPALGLKGVGFARVEVEAHALIVAMLRKGRHRCLCLPQVVE